MYRQSLKTRQTESLDNGIEPSDFNQTLTVHYDHKHGRVYDLIIAGHNTTCIVPSRNLIMFIDEWGVHDKAIVQINSANINSNGPFQRSAIQGTIIHTTYDYASDGTDSLELSGNDTTLMYKCQTRKAFIYLNELKNALKAMERIERQRNKPNPTYTRMYIALLFEDTTKALQFIEDFSRTEAIQILESDKFRHAFKLLHKDTEFYHVKP